jgi:transposase
LIEKLVASLLGLTRLVRERGTTIARLRRLVGLSSSEKTADVLGPRPGPEEPTRDGPGRGAPDDSGGTLREARTGDKDDPAKAAPKPERKRSETKGATADKRKGHGRLPASAYPHACHTPVPHETLRPGDRCPACGEGRLYELADPTHFLRIVGQPPLSARCWCCQRLRCCPCGAVFTAQAPAEAQGDKYSDSAAAMIALLRYRAGMPHHRLEQIQQNLDVPVPASTQSEVVDERAEDLRAVHEELKRLAAQGGLLHSDDTRGPILEFMGKRRAALMKRGELPNPERTGLFTTGVVSIIDEERTVALFMTGRQHAGENLSDLLDLRSADLRPPTQMSDALSWNPPKGHTVIECHCLAHARRHLIDEVGNHPEECGYLLERLEQVFKVDALCRRYRLLEEPRLRLHQRQSAPVMGEIEAWMRAQFAQKRIEPNSGLGKAIDYMLSRWSTFTLFLRVPGAPLTNNICERALKAAIRHRNHSLFYRSGRGAQVGDIYMSIIYTAEINGQNALAYLTTLLRHAKAVAQNPADWLPWNYRATLSRLAARGDPGQQDETRAVA